ncbi:MAG: fibro-slime domain-containing protein, partial [Chitinispirillia bacterium]
MKFLGTALTFIVIIAHAYLFDLLAQSGDTIWIPVTYYDFHSNGSNPNFNQNFGNHLIKGMVKNNLSPDSKPLLNKVFPEVMNDRIEEWFRPSGAGPEAVFNAEDNRWTGLVPYNGKKDEWISQKFDPSYDMANVVIYDSLPLVRNQGNSNVYNYQNHTFFPLDKKGFGNEETQYPEHNYSFTMEVHTAFRYLPQENQFFEFLGDDDVWVFINGKLSLDLGGAHHPAYGRIQFDKSTAEKFDLDSGKIYPLDFFFAERQVTNSRIQFQTNMKIIKRKLRVDVIPGKTIKAGETAKCVAYIWSDTGVVSLTELSGNVKWEFKDLKARNPKSILKPRYDTS